MTIRVLRPFYKENNISDCIEAAPGGSRRVEDVGDDVAAGGAIGVGEEEGGEDLRARGEDDPADQPQLQPRHREQYRDNLSGNF